MTLAFIVDDPGTTLDIHELKLWDRIHLLFYEKLRILAILNVSEIYQTFSTHSFLRAS